LVVLPAQQKVVIQTIIERRRRGAMVHDPMLATPAIAASMFPLM